jgi:subtilase family serine protease
MQHVQLRLTAKLAALLVAALPLAAQPAHHYFNPPLKLAARSGSAPALVPGCVTPTCYSPAELRVGYGFRAIPGVGGGQIIAIVDAYDDPNAEADLGVFSTQFHLPACTTANGCFSVVYQTGTKPPKDTGGWSDEVAIDTQWAHSIAPGAKIMLVESNSNSDTDLYAAVDKAVAMGASVVSMSWSGGEFPSELSDDVHFSAPGVTFVAASGDGGHGSQYPVASPYVVGVGGTSLILNTSTGQWISETAWSGSGGGVSKYEPEPTYQMSAQSTGMRGIPDVAYDGDPNTGVPSYSSWSCAFCYTGWNQWGGTSIGTPMWAAFFAKVNSLRAQLGKATLTQPQTYLYPAAAPGGYHDITSGTNGGCGSQCTAGPGYDFVTGLGSPQANLLIPVLVNRVP